MGMISTKCKFKIPKHLSYPVNAKMLSEGLEGVPQYEKLSVAFHDSSTFLKSAFQKQVQEKKTILVLSVDYRNIKPGFSASQWGIEHGFYEENWEIVVYAVPNEQKPVIQESLRSSGFPAIREWLTEKRPPSWYNGRKSLNLGYDLGKCELVKTSGKSRG